MNPKNKTSPTKGKSQSITDTPDLSDSVATAFSDTSEMIDYLDFLDTLDDALKRGDSEAMLPTAFLSRVRYQFQPMDYPHLRQAWNRVCDELGKPDEKVPEPAEPPEPQGGEQGPF